MWDVPALRFPEFTGEWKKCKLGDSCHVLMCKRILASQTNPISGVPFYKIGTIGSTPDSYISRDLFDLYKRKYSYPRKGEVMITCAGTVGKCIIFDGLDAYFQDSNIVWIDNPTEEIQNTFLFYVLSRVDWHRLNSTTIIRIYNDDLRGLHINFPTTAEQNKIVRLLSLLDARISTQSKVIEDLKKLKSAISKSLLSCSDLLEKRVPISEIGTLKNGYAFQSSFYDSAGEYKVLTISNVTGERYICSEGCNCVLTKPSDIQYHQELKANDILISLTGNVGRVSLCKEGKYLLNQRVGLLQLDSAVNREFIYQVLSSRNFEKSMISCSQGAAQMNIGKGDVENYIIPYSCNPKNLCKVSLILNSYDTKILIENKMLHLLNKQKVYLLASLFI